MFAFSEHAMRQRKFNYAIREVHQRLLHSLYGYIILYYIIQLTYLIDSKCLFLIL
jgi:hypothetical protein